jgi:rubrerythrin
MNLKGGLIMNTKDLINEMIEDEKEGINEYKNMKKFINKKDTKKINEIIHQEKNHLRILKEMK